MRTLFIRTGIFIGGIIDWFYPPFRTYVSRRFFRYGVSGVLNVCFDWVLYFLVYNFVIRKQLVHLGFVTISPHIASLLLTFPVSFFSGFLLQKYVTFSASQLRGKEQLMRYLAVVGANLLINYFGLKLLVEALHIYPTPSKMLVTVATTIFSYFSQKNFTFKINNDAEQK